MCLCESDCTSEQYLSTLAFINIFLFKSNKFHKNTIPLFDAGRNNSFDARHIELFATEEYRGGDFFFKVVGKEEIEKEAPGFTVNAAIFDPSHHMRDAATLRVFDVPSWEGKESMVTPNGVAVKAYVGEFHHNGRVVFFYEKIKIRNEVLLIHVSFVA